MIRNGKYASSADDNPPMLLHPGNYEFIAVGRADDDYSVFRSSESGISRDDIIERLRDIADRMEADA